MSIYTITLSREQLVREAGVQDREEGCGLAGDASSSNRQQSESRVAHLSPSGLDPNKENIKPSASAADTSAAGAAFEHSINVTLEVNADLKQPNRIVWFKNHKQLTSSEQPVYFVGPKDDKQTPADRLLATQLSTTTTKTTHTKTSTTTRSSSVKSEKDTRQAASAAVGIGQLQEVEVNEEQEEEILTESKRAAPISDGTEGAKVVKCKQISNNRGSKLIIYDLQDDDYDQYTCKLIDLQTAKEYKVETRLRQKQAEQQVQTSDQQQATARRSYNINMDEVIECKDGDFNIELGIQILPETNDDEELMSEEEKADFIKNTTITWFKDDVKLNEQDPKVTKLFQFNYDQAEGSHRLIVRKASKETEGVYTCLVENEAGTSSCSTRLIVGPGNKPKLTSRLQDVTVSVGQTLEFRVKSSGEPQIDRCQWFKDDLLIIELGTTSSQSESVTSSKTSRISMHREEQFDNDEKLIVFRLCINDLKLDDTGKYKCRISNEFGYDETDCFVKVIQEIIEEHEEVEEHIEETTRLGGGRKSTREEIVEEEQQVEELDHELIRRREEEEQKLRAEKRRRLNGEAPKFVKTLTDVVVEEEATTTSSCVELETSTQIDEWSESDEQLKVRWFINDLEVSSTSDEYEIENFYKRAQDQWFHRLIKKSSSASARSSSRRQSFVETSVCKCKASNKFGESETSCTIASRATGGSATSRPNFLKRLEDVEANVGETVTFSVAVDESSTSNKTEDVQFIKDGKIVYSSLRDGSSKDTEETTTKSRIRVRSFEQTIETTTTTTREDSYSRYSSARRRSSLLGDDAGPKLAKVYELTVENVQLDQMGQWQCSASNKAGTTTCSADLEVFQEPKIVTDLSGTIRVVPSDEIRLTVEATGEPRPVYSWFKDGAGIAEEQDRVFTSETTKRRTTTAGSTTTTMRRRSSVSTLERLDEQGQNVTGEILIIKGARPEDAGHYQCKVENRLGQVESTECRVTVIGHGDDLNKAPQIIKDISSSKIVIDEGECLNLKVLADGQPKPSAHWFKDSSEIKTTDTTKTTSTNKRASISSGSSRRNSRIESENVGQEYELKVKRVRDNDKGTYKLVLRNKFGETQSRTVELEVRKLSAQEEAQRSKPSAPSISLDCEDKVVGLDSTVCFDATVAGHPKPFITWYRNGRRMTESGDGRISFVEEETTVTTVTTTTTTTTTATDETDTSNNNNKTATTHRLVIRNVRDSDEAIYSLKAENDLGSSKSSLVSLTVDKRKAASDELEQLERAKQQVAQSKQQQQQQEQVTEEVTTTTTTTTVDEAEDDEAAREEAENRRAKSRQTTQTTVTTKTTTTTTTEEEQEEQEAASRRQTELLSEQQQQQEESESSQTTTKTKSRRTSVLDEQTEDRRRSKRTQQDELVDQQQEEQDEEEEEEITERSAKTTTTKTSKVDESEKRRKVVRDDEDQDDEHSGTTTRMDVDDDEQIDEQTSRKTTRRDDESTTTTSDSKAPRLVKVPKSVVAGLGSSPEIEVEVETSETTVTETTKVTWTKDGQPIPARLLRDNHIEILEKSDQVDSNKKKHILRINSLRSSDAASYKLKVENPFGEAETDDIDVSVDRTMRPGEQPKVEQADVAKPRDQPTAAKPEPSSEDEAPEVVRVPEEIVAGIGSSPVIEAAVKGSPEPEITWFKDGQPLGPDELSTGHLEVVDLPSDQPDVKKQGLKINKLRPDDVAAYHVKAENPQGEAESEPTNLRIDRSMGPKEEPIVTMPDEPMDVDQQPTQKQVEKPVAPQPEKSVNIPEATSPVLEVPIENKPQQVQWLKDGKPIEDTPTGDRVEATSLPDGTQQLKINDLKPEDAGAYSVKATNPAGEVESAPINVQVAEPLAESAPQIVEQPEKIVAGPGSHPELEVVVKSNPEAEVQWVKDGKPITERRLSDGHLELAEERDIERPDEVKHKLKIDEAKGIDAGDYKLVAKNPLGTAESKPMALNIDRSKKPTDEPEVTQLSPEALASGPDASEPAAGGVPSGAPEIVSAPKEVKAGPHSSPVLEAEVKAQPEAKVEWLKDGEPIPARHLRDGHVTLDSEPGDQPDTVKHQLKIDDLKPSDAGEYTVKATNPVGQAESEPIKLSLDRSMGPSDEPEVVPGVDKRPTQDAPSAPSDAADRAAAPAHLSEQVAPKIISTPEEVKAGIGSTPVLEVECISNPEAKVTWLKDDTPIPTRLLRDGHIEITKEPVESPASDFGDTSELPRTKHVLKINSVKPTDEAEYKAVAVNDLGEATSEPIKLKISRRMSAVEEPKVVPRKLESPEIVGAPEEIVAGIGSSPVIEAAVKGSPEPEITWFKDGQPLGPTDLSDGHLEVVDLPSDEPDVKKQGLKINKLRPDDVAAYHVKAENPQGEAESEPTNLRIDRSMGPSDEPIVTMPDEPMDVDQPSQKVSKPVEKPVAPQPEKSVNIPEATSPVLEVPIENKPQQVQWLKDGKPVEDTPTGDRVEATSLPDGTQQLKINDLKPEDAGAYSVKASNPAGEVESAPINVSVAEPLAQSAPKIINQPKEVRTGPGGHPELEVVVKANPDAEVQWVKDGKPITERRLSDGHLELAEERNPLQPDEVAHKLKVDEAKGIDAGDYKLVAKNPLGTAESKPIALKLDRSMSPSEDAKVTDLQPSDDVRGKPSDQDSPAATGPAQAPEIVSAPKEVKAGPHSSPVLEAEVKAQPEAKVEWLKDGEPIPARHLRDGHVTLDSEPGDQPDTVKHQLKIDDLKPSDAGEYTVKATNPVGQAVSEPIKLSLDRSMGPSDEPKVVPAEVGVAETQLADQLAPKLIAAAEEVVAGAGSSPVLEVDCISNPEAKVTWLKDGEPLPARLLRDGHIETSEQPVDARGDDLAPGDQPAAKRHSLKINNLKPTDEAEYKARAVNDLGEAESEPIHLTVDRRMSITEAPRVVGRELAAPEIVSVPEEIVAGIGSSPVIEAAVKGSPEPEITWFKDGQPLGPTDLSDGHLEVVDLPSDQPDVKKQGLKINKLRPDDVAAYHVKAENPQGEAESEPTNLRIDRSMGPSDEPQVIGGEPADLSDDTSASKPAPDVSIRKPTLPKVSRDIKAPVGSSPVLEVEVTGGEPDKIEWFKDGKPIGETPDMHIEVESRPDGVQKLTVNNLKPEDAGVYTVKASNPAGSDQSAPIKLTPVPKATSVTSAKPEIVCQTGELSAAVGGQPELEVVVYAKPEAQVTWFKDGRPIKDSDRVTIKSEPVSKSNPDQIKHSLGVDQFKPSDAGQYHAVATNPVGETKSEPISVKLVGPDEPAAARAVESQNDNKAPSDGGHAPQIVSFPEEIVAGVGSSPVLEVEVRALPEAETSWFKDGQPISEADLNSGHLEIQRKQVPNKPDTVCESLKINNLKPADVAAYHLQAENVHGDIESEPTNLRIDRSMGPSDKPQVCKQDVPFDEDQAGDRPLVAPSFVRIPRKVVAALGSNPAIEVVVAGQPKAEVVWFKDGAQVSDLGGKIAISERPDEGVHVLQFTNLKAIDQGDYTVRATNEAGEIQSSPISLIISTDMSPKDQPKVVDSTEPEEDTRQQVDLANGLAPKIVFVSDKQVAELGGQVGVAIEVKASPQAQVSWFKDGQELPAKLIEDGHVVVVSSVKADQPDVCEHKLELTALKPSDAGTYHLQAENPLGSCVSPKVSVAIKPPSDVVDNETGKKKPLRAPQIKRVPRQVQAKEGDSPVLEVEISGEPKPEVVWFRNGIRIEKSDTKYTIGEQPNSNLYTLTVHDVTKAEDDGAVYSLEATNEAGTAESEPIKLQVESAKRLSKRDSTKTTGVAPAIVSAPSSVETPLGETVKLEVVVEASKPEDVEITWFKGDATSPIDATKKPRKFKIETTPRVAGKPNTLICTLVISDVQQDDLTSYFISATNPFGTTKSAPIDVVEQPTSTKKPMRAPVIKRMPRKIVAPLGSNPVIEVEISGQPRPEIVWFKNGRKVTTVRDHITFEEAPNGVYRLCFTNCKATDQAEYTFVAKNELGTVESEPISLIVDRNLEKSDGPFVQDALLSQADDTAADFDGPLVAPKILGLDDQEAIKGGIVKLEAEVLGNPKPQIKWLKDGDEVELNVINEVPNSNKHSLTLKDVSELYDGVYSLEASNPAGTARKDATIRVVDKLSVSHQPVGVDKFEMAPKVDTIKRKEPEEPREKPFIRKGLKFSQVNQGRNIKLEVQVDGKYDELVWLKDGKPIDLSTGLEAPTSPEEHDNDDDDDKSTICGDEDDDDLADASGDKKKRHFAPKILVRPRNVLAGPGSRVALEVKFSGEPVPEVTWFKNGDKITTTGEDSHRIYVEDLEQNWSRLVIEDLQECDLAEYQVLIENDLGYERSVPVTVQLDSDMVASDDLNGIESPSGDSSLKRGRAPRLLRQPQSVCAPPGSKIAFEIQVSGEPKPVINWFKDGKLVVFSSDGRVTVKEYSNGVVRLVVDKITANDVGQYEASAENSLGSARTIPVSLTLDETNTTELVDMHTETIEHQLITEANDSLAAGQKHNYQPGRPPRILLRPRQIQAKPGASLTLEVSVTGQIKPSIVWYRNGRRVATSDRVTIEKVSDDYERLIITQLDESDSGCYTVTAENQFGTATSLPAQVTVSSSSTAATTTTEETTTTTTTTTEESSFFERFVADGSDKFGPESPSGKRAPRFTLKPRSKRATPGAKVDFECCVSGEPKPEVVWFKNGRRIHHEPNGRVRVEEFSDGCGSRLLIDDVEDIDHGVYAAEATNELGKARTQDVQLRVTRKHEFSESKQVSEHQSGAVRVTTTTRRTKTHYTVCEERGGYVSLLLEDAQLEHDGDYKLVVRNKWGEAATQAPLIVIPRAEPRGSADRSSRSLSLGPTDDSEPSGRSSGARTRTPFDELDDYNHELDRSIGIYGSESRYQSGEDTYLLQLRDTEFPLRLRKYLRFGARQSPSLRSNLMDSHWGAGARVTVRERRKFRDVMDEEIDDEKRGLDTRPTPMRLQKEIGTCGYGAAQLEHLRVEAAERAVRKSAERQPIDMMPPFFREKLKDCVIEEKGHHESDVAIFSCLAIGEPQPEYSWFRNDIIITPDTERMTIVATKIGSDGNSSTMTGSELHIREPRLYDAGCFKCCARNVHGNVTCRARLRVAARPSRPEPPECSNASAREVLLRWKPPRDFDVNTAQVLGYRLEMSQSGIGEVETWSVVAADIGQQFYLVDNLSPLTSYSFQIRARNKFGWSDSSYATYVTTCKEADAFSLKQQVPFELRSRQCLADLCSANELRTCEDPIRPERLDYNVETVAPVALETSQRWTDTIKLQAEISRGRFSLIATAVRTSDKQDDLLAAKIVAISEAGEAQTKNEFDLWRSLQHEKLAKLHLAFKDEQHFVFIMERYSGLDVVSYLASFSTYNEEMVSKIITQVMDAIEYLHFRGMCLLELLPDNVVMTNGRSCSIKLTDFSSARFVPKSGARVHINLSQSVEYCPPEVIASHEVSTASDVWCIGVLTYVLLSGFSPFKGDSEDETRENVRLGRYKYDHLYANCTPEVTRFLINVFKKHSSKRPTIEQLYENKWLLPNEFMIRKRQHATFGTDKILAFADEFHRKKAASFPKKLVELLN